MISTQKLIDFIKSAKFPEDLKKRLFPIAQMASDEDKRTMWEIVTNWQKKAEDVAKRHPELSLEKQLAILQKPNMMQLEMSRKAEKMNRKQEKKRLMDITKEMDKVFAKV